MISQRFGEKGTKASPCLLRTALPRALTCPAPPPSSPTFPWVPSAWDQGVQRDIPVRRRGEGGWREKQFPFPFCTKPAGEGDTFPQPGFQTEGRQGDTARAGCKVTVTPSAPTEQNAGQPAGLSSPGWEKPLWEGMLAGRAVRGGLRHVAGAGDPAQGT